MSPESINYQSVAETLLERAQRAFLVEIYEDAARGAYTAALNAASAVVFEKTGLAVKTHSGARAKLHELIHNGCCSTKKSPNFCKTASIPSKASIMVMDPCL